MKKYFLFLLLFVLFFDINAQLKIGITCSPGLSVTRVKYKNDVVNINDDGVAFTIKLGLEIDFPITETYFFSTGLIFAPKRAKYLLNGPSGILKEEYKIQYLQIPFTLKLYTNEIIPDIKAYVQLGILGEIKIFDEPLDNAYTLVTKFKAYDTSFLFGIGVEYGASISTLLYATIVYNRGLLDIINKSTATNNLSTKLDIISLQLGIKF